MTFSSLQLEACAYLFEKNNGKQLSLVEENILSQTGVDQFEVKELINLLVDGLNDGAYHNTQTHTIAYFVLGKAFAPNLLTQFQEWLKIELDNQQHQAVYQLMIALENLGESVFNKKARGNGVSLDEYVLNLFDAQCYINSLALR